MKKRIQIRRGIRFSLFVVLAGIGTGCGKKNEYAPPPPPQVEVVKAAAESVKVYGEYGARTEAAARVEIRARVDGLLESKDFQSGDYVEKGQVLYTIEPEKYEAALKAAKGRLRKAKADETIAETEYKRKKQAFETNRAVSELEVLTSEAQWEAAKAAVEIEEASVADAERNVGYTKVKAPIAGRTSDGDYDIGSLVSAQSATLLNSIVQDDVIYASFEVNERFVIPFLPNRPGNGKEMEVPEKSLRLVLADGTAFSQEGKFRFLDNEVNPETGTINVQAEFPNPDIELAAGMFVRIQIPQELENVTLVPASAVQRDLGGSFVLLVGPENQIERRTVILSRFDKGGSKIAEPYDEETNTGIKTGEKIVVSNLQRVRPGMTVQLAQPKPKEPGQQPEAQPKE